MVDVRLANVVELVVPVVADQPALEGEEELGAVGAAKARGQLVVPWQDSPDEYSDSQWRVHVEEVLAAQVVTRELAKVHLVEPGFR